MTGSKGRKDSRNHGNDGNEAGTGTRERQSSLPSDLSQASDLRFRESGLLQRSDLQQEGRSFRRRRRGGRFIFCLSALAVLVCLYFVLLSSPVLCFCWLPLLSAVTGVELSAEEAELSPIRGCFRVSGLSGSGSLGKGKTFEFSVRNASLAFQIPALLSGRTGLHSVDAEGVYFLQRRKSRGADASEKDFPDARGGRTREDAFCGDEGKRSGKIPLLHLIPRWKTGPLTLRDSVFEWQDESLLLSGERESPENEKKRREKGEERRRIRFTVDSFRSGGWSPGERRELFLNGSLRWEQEGIDLENLPLELSAEYVTGENLVPREGHLRLRLESPEGKTGPYDLSLLSLTLDAEGAYNPETGRVELSRFLFKESRDGEESLHVSVSGSFHPQTFDADFRLEAVMDSPHLYFLPVLSRFRTDPRNLSGKWEAAVSVRDLDVSCRSGFSASAETLLLRNAVFRDLFLKSEQNVEYSFRRREGTLGEFFLDLSADGGGTRLHMRSRGKAGFELSESGGIRFDAGNAGLELTLSGWKLETLSGLMSQKEGKLPARFSGSLSAAALLQTSGNGRPEAEGNWKITAFSIPGVLARNDTEGTFRLQSDPSLREIKVLPSRVFFRSAEEKEHMLDLRIEGAYSLRTRRAAWEGALLGNPARFSRILLGKKAEQFAGIMKDIPRFSADFQAESRNAGESGTLKAVLNFPFFFFPSGSEGASAPEDFPAGAVASSSPPGGAAGKKGSGEKKTATPLRVDWTLLKDGKRFRIPSLTVSGGGGGGGGTDGEAQVLDLRAEGTFSLPFSMESGSVEIRRMNAEMLSALLSRAGGKLRGRRMAKWPERLGIEELFGGKLSFDLVPGKGKERVVRGQAALRMRDGSSLKAELQSPVRVLSGPLRLLSLPCLELTGNSLSLPVWGNTLFVRNEEAFHFSSGRVSGRVELTADFRERKYRLVSEGLEGRNVEFFTRREKPWTFGDCFTAGALDVLLRKELTFDHLSFRFPDRNTAFTLSGHLPLRRGEDALFHLDADVESLSGIFLADMFPLFEDRAIPGICSLQGSGAWTLDPAARINRFSGDFTFRELCFASGTDAAGSELHFDVSKKPEGLFWKDSSFLLSVSPAPFSASLQEDAGEPAPAAGRMRQPLQEKKGETKKKILSVFWDGGIGYAGNQTETPGASAPELSIRSDCMDLELLLTCFPLSSSSSSSSSSFVPASSISSSFSEASSEESSSDSFSESASGEERVRRKGLLPEDSSPSSEDGERRGGETAPPPPFVHRDGKEKNWQTRLNLSLGNITYTDELSATLNGTIHLDPECLSSEELFLNLNGSPLHFGGRLGFGEKELGCPFSLTLSSGQLHLAPLFHVFSHTPLIQSVTAEVESLSCTLEGKCASEALLKETLSGNLEMTLGMLSFPFSAKDTLLALEILLLPMEYLPDLIALIPLENVRNGLTGILENVKEMIAGRQDISFRNGAVRLSVEQGKVFFQEVCLDGSVIRSEIVGGEVNPFANTARVETVTHFGLLRFPLLFEGPLHSLHADLSRFPFEFMKENTVPLLSGAWAVINGELLREEFFPDTAAEESENDNQEGKNTASASASSSETASNGDEYRRSQTGGTEEQKSSSFLPSSSGEKGSFFFSREFFPGFSLP